MLLRHSPNSPYVRKVVVLLHETGLADRVTIETIDGWSEPDLLTADNPLSLVPTLVLNDGSSLFDSPVICDYLDHCHAGLPLIPAGGESRWQVLREQALADGILDCAVMIFMELHRRPAELRWDWWLDLKGRAIRRALDQLERDASGLADRVDLGTIAIACALGYLDLRGAVGEWRDGRPQLAAWYQVFAERPSMIVSARRAETASQHRSRPTCRHAAGPRLWHPLPGAPPRSPGAAALTIPRPRPPARSRGDRSQGKTNTSP